MRPFGFLALELLNMAVPMVRGIVTGEWSREWLKDPLPRAELLQRWDQSTAELDALRPKIPASKFQETITSFGQSGPVYWQVLYVIDDEIHHRGQGYVYLRALEIELPPFWDRDRGEVEPVARSPSLLRATVCAVTPPDVACRSTRIVVLTHLVCMSYDHAIPTHSRTVPP
jgi:hypothetical protein